MKLYLILFAIVLYQGISVNIYAQDFKVPKDYTLDSEEDFAKYKEYIIPCINWLENTPINQQANKRKEANVFLITWLTGTPDLVLELNADMLNFSKKNPELIATFMGGWAKYDLENPGNKDKIKSNYAGFKSVMKVYKMGNGIQKDKEMDKLIKLDEKGELEKWIKENVE